MFLLPFLIYFSAVALAVFQYTASVYPGRSGYLLRWLSSLLFASSSLMFALIVCEILQAGDHDARATLWKLCTILLLVLLELVSPAVQLWRLVGYKLPKMRNIIVVPIYLGYLITFRVLSKQLPVERYEHTSLHNNTTWFNMRQDTLACISFVGITTMALLCGISSISAPYTAFVAHKNRTSEVDADHLKSSIRGINSMMRSKELEINRLRLEITCGKTSGNNSASVSPNASTFSLSRLVNLMRTNNDRENELHNLQTEYDALCKLQVEVESDLESVNQKLFQQQYFTTIQGRLYRAAYTVFAVYCIYNVGNSFGRMTWLYLHKSRSEGTIGGPRDAIVLLIAKSISGLYPELGIEGWSRVIGVFMSGVVFAAAINGVLNMSFKIMRLLHKPEAAKAALRLDWLLAGQVVGVYVLSIATTLRFNLPRSMSGPIMSAVISPLKVSSVQLWTDTVMCLTSTIVCAVLVIVNRVRNDHIYDGEMGETKCE